MSARRLTLPQVRKVLAARNPGLVLEVREDGVDAFKVRERGATAWSVITRAEVEVERVVLREEEAARRLWRPGAWRRAEASPEAVERLERVLGSGAYFMERPASLSGDVVAHAPDGEPCGCGQTIGQALRDAVGRRS